MSRALIAVISSCVIAVCIAQQSKHATNNDGYLQLYKQADKLYIDAERLSGTKNFTDQDEENMNKKALEKFRQVTVMIQRDAPKNDSLAFFCYLKTGILEHYFGNLSPARNAYNNSIKLKKSLPALADSLLFKPYLYAGSIYYLQDNFDSAFILYKKAEEIIRRYPVRINETERLYNTFGNIYISTGNYKQAKNYFEKAISVLPVTHPYYEALLVNYKINIAGTLIHLEEYDKADSIYRSLLPYNINSNEIEHNSGLIKLYKSDYKAAIKYFHKTNYDDSKKVSLHNSMAQAYMGIGNKDSAVYYLKLATNENTTFNGERKNNDYGTTLKLSGDLLLAQNKYTEAILIYQQAIVQFDPAFNDINTLKNPANYSGVFTYIGLFNTLTAKANAFKILYDAGKKQDDLKSALDAYRAAYTLIAYVERTYDSDEARLFLNKTKYSIRSLPIEINFTLFGITNDKKYLEEAYLFDQRNKATILALNVQQNEFRRTSENNNDIFAREDIIKSLITRLSLKATQAAGNTEIKALNDAIRDNEIRLSKTQDTINNDPSFARYRLAEKIPSVTDIQQKILDNNTALLSYHLSQDHLFTFCITADSFSCYKQTIDTNFFVHINSFVSSLHNVSGETKFNGESDATNLNKILFSPLQQYLKNINRLIIIPEDELNYVPFEALADEKGNFLLTTYAIQYQYSASLIGNTTQKEKNGNNILAMAPFAGASYTDTIQKATFNQLTNSLAEVKDLRGQIIINNNATKAAFLQQANHYGIIHLATHASVNDLYPEKSFIAFYPNSNDYLLFAREIADLNLDSTRLIILSACETGSGQLIKGEGVMSLSRAFAYAGCPNIITSLWKAEDKTSAFLSQRLHFYIGEGYTRDKALQQSKIDLLNSHTIEQRFKTPNYWAHLILIDNYQADKKRSSLWWIFPDIILVVIAALSFLLERKKKLSRRSEFRYPTKTPRTQRKKPD